MGSELRFVAAAGASVAVSIATVVAFALTTSVVLADAPAVPVRAASVVVPAATGAPVSPPAVASAETSPIEESIPEPPVDQTDSEWVAGESAEGGFDEFAERITSEAEQVFPDIAEDILREISGGAANGNGLKRGHGSGPDDNRRDSAAQKGRGNDDR